MHKCIYYPYIHICIFAIYRPRILKLYNTRNTTQNNMYILTPFYNLSWCSRNVHTHATAHALCKAPYVLYVYIIYTIYYIWNAASIQSLPQWSEFCAPVTSQCVASPRCREGLHWVYHAQAMSPIYTARDDRATSACIQRLYRLEWCALRCTKQTSIWWKFIFHTAVWIL